MNIKQALEILNQNEQASNDTFLYYLHEQCQFHKQAYQEYCTCLTVLSSEFQNIVTKEITKTVLHLHTYIVSCFIYHFDSNDLYEIKDVPPNYQEVIENLNKLLEELIMKQVDC